MLLFRRRGRGLVGWALRRRGRRILRGGVSWEFEGKGSALEKMGTEEERERGEAYLPNLLPMKELRAIYRRAIVRMRCSLDCWNILAKRFDFGDLT